MAKRKTRAELLAQIESAKNELEELEQEECMTIGRAFLDVFGETVDGMDAKKIKKLMVSLKVLNDRQKAEASIVKETTAAKSEPTVTRQTAAETEDIESSAGDIPGSPLF